jgi:hypothetical protein
VAPAGRPYALRVLSDGRHVSRSSRLKLAYLITGGVVVVAAVVLIVLMLGGADVVPGLGGTDRPPTPEFTFETRKVTAVATRAGTQASELETDATTASDEVAATMDALYIGAFLDPANWQEGSFGEVWDLFDEGSSAAAQEQADTLTAGTGAGDAFDTILPDVGVLRTQVLFDQEEQPFSVVAIVRFEATGSGKGGAANTLITSQGQFVFQMVDGDWRVVSFKVTRNDEQQEPSPSAVASASESSS